MPVPSPPLDLLRGAPARRWAARPLVHPHAPADPDPAPDPVLEYRAQPSLRKTAIPSADGVSGAIRDGDQVVSRGPVELAAVRAELPCEPLREHAGDGGPGHDGSTPISFSRVMALGASFVASSRP